MTNAPLQLEDLLRLPGVVAAWQWRLERGVVPVVIRYVGSTSEDVAELGALYLNMMTQVAESQSLLLDQRMEGENFFPVEGVVVGGASFIVVGTPNRVAVTLRQDDHVDLWVVQEQMERVELPAPPS